ncbi:hypothetical protein ACTSKR_11945 [Chitinibacteraceae bacterium HSL-7]
MNCTGCGAPLAIDALVCGYCGLHNAVDLLAIRDFRVLDTHSDLTCPAGCGDLQRIRLGAGLDVTVGFCGTCKGLHFAPGATELALARVAAQVREINHGRIRAIKAQRVTREVVQYRPCAVCRDRMVRRIYSQHIPVMVDVCRDHGMWLDGGEFSVLAEWAEAGGEQVVRQQAADSARMTPAMTVSLDADRVLADARGRRPARSAGRFHGLGDLPRWVFPGVVALWSLAVSGLSIFSGIMVFITLAVWGKSRRD